MDSLFYRTARKGITLGAFLKKLVRNKRALAVLVVGIPLLVYLLFGSHGIVQRVKLQQKRVELEAQIREAEAETKRLQAESAALDGDKKAIEKTAREKYGMAREGETVYKVAPAK
jgi:cell division protein FtsB